MISRFLVRFRRRNTIALLYALWKKERYEAKGFTAFVHRGIFLSDGLWEVYVMPKTHRCKTCGQELNR